MHQQLTILTFPFNR